ncbi:MAG TPA: hypothetical protein PKD19_00110 [Candidatus Saccharibacteria bacterium]|nr:hypothetical protein [Candidatus Saccharibacteria bacterium]HMR38185.1 hypothetical protein [Candidatus Saccharibacteria bacterium]
MADILRPNPSDFAVPSETTTGIVTRQEKGKKHGRIARAGAALVGTLMLATACAPKAETKAPTIEPTNTEPVATATQTPEVAPSPSPSPAETANIESGEYIPETAYTLDAMNERIENMTSEEIDKLSLEERAELIYAMYVQAAQQWNSISNKGINAVADPEFRNGDNTGNAILKSWKDMSNEQRGAALTMLEVSAMFDMKDRPESHKISEARMKNMLRILYTADENTSLEKYRKGMTALFEKGLKDKKVGYDDEGRHKTLKLGRKIEGEGENKKYDNYLASTETILFDEDGNETGIGRTGMIIVFVPVERGTSFEGISEYARFMENPDVPGDTGKPAFDEKTDKPVYTLGENKGKQVFVPIIVEMGRHLLE